MHKLDDSTQHASLLFSLTVYDLTNNFSGLLCLAFVFLHGVCLAALAAEELGFERFHSVIQ